MKQVRATLARIHNFSPEDDRAIEMIVFNEFMKQIDMMSAALRILLGLIGTLTLAIGGIGLANIMLVSVTQRTREIGIIKVSRSDTPLDSVSVPAGGDGDRDDRRHCSGLLLAGLPHAADRVPAASRPAVQGHQRPRRHSPRHIQLLRHRFHRDARDRRLNLGLFPALRASRLQAIEALRFE